MHKHILARSVGLALLASGLLAGCGDKGEAGQGAGEMPPAAVDVVTLHAAPLQLMSELTGRTAPLRVAEVRPQVNGIILKRLFTEGSDVKAGQLLYQIDPAVYQAAVASAKANLAKAQANEQSARLKAQRYAELVKVKAISRQEYDDADAAWKQQVAEIGAAKAALQSANINLAYTKITAPISGRIGKSAVTEGALVTAQQADSLTSISQLDPMYVDVRQSTADLLRLKRQVAAGKLVQDESKGAKVRFQLEDGSQYSEEGSLQFSDVTVDETTGMVTLRVLVPNPHDLLLPGMFMRATLQEGERPQGLLVPQTAVTRTPKGGATVMVVTADNKVELREVQLSRVVGDSWVVESGLKAGEKVIVAGLQKVKPGALVAPAERASNTTTAQADQTQVTKQ
ncbi:efflux RND transporter periplasmic adaptor subunit [Aeromonas rivipollensis]|uniref:Efflux RND transporter periplasmic adaptor subunit n=1 Tax=Aeromonas rivipollensis TaxID=948519 RepID=A0AAW9YGS5_9GAMM|nr:MULTISPECIES: efflux RND transporter periplasmic adaptor subunit [Aeromonas]QIY85715.1 efflux RND transporter periplasmic adaptor subunit [Aeromonas hydrophila]MBS4699212.1 efflux RND transporter periplasmic adaptor subunit [Aeromonas media]MCE9955904.1 efflux RND transporter periplasmic adaptor subunit [Aeromonas rivipollensis]MDM5084996.1 efflux RND transporter periplasmic adaptor subunit [Aeromonas rivipollensis]MDM5097067.1 efflux RND transporter periplasmic adaptor subunit [Aeromonas r